LRKIVNKTRTGCGRKIDIRETIGPRNTWRHELESEIKITRKTWKDLEKTALDRRAVKDVVVDLCLQGAKR
jgi:hypothetical protein